MFWHTPWCYQTQANPAFCLQQPVRYRHIEQPPEDASLQMVKPVS